MWGERRGRPQYLVRCPGQVGRSQDRFDLPVHFPSLRRSGRFLIAVSDPTAGPLALVISQPLAVDLEIDPGVSEADEEIVVVVPDPEPDPRAQVARVAKVLTAEQEALGSASAVLGGEVGSRQAGGTRIRQAVDAVLTDLTEGGGGDRR